MQSQFPRLPTRQRKVKSRPPPHPIGAKAKSLLAKTSCAFESSFYSDRPIGAELHPTAPFHHQPEAFHKTRLENNGASQPLLTIVLQTKYHFGPHQTTLGFFPKHFLTRSATSEQSELPLLMNAPSGATFFPVALMKAWARKTSLDRATNRLAG